MCLPLPHLTSVSTNEVPAGGSVLAGIGCTLVQLLLAVAPRVAQGALAVVRVAGIDADARVLAQAVGGHPWGPEEEDMSRKTQDVSGSDQL